MIVFLVAGAIHLYHNEGQRTERTSLHDQTVGWRPFLSSSIPIESQLVQTEPPGLAAVSLICAPLSLKPPYPTGLHLSEVRRVVGDETGGGRQQLASN